MDKKKNEVKTPMGTIALLFIFAVILVVLWSSAYLTMLSRGVN